ncbi:membrane protein [Pseudoalteromonas sp. A25]|uniref:porin family protein n=1 Tax=Pseudoalteromonas sp. A25 TaxID=116092 RepID=UPI001260EEC3|nr:porin family protein [Pseudoalteromonas sp. A25]BBN80900.1 membrane protein [Pseudoalteromonas sp. A25]
MKHLSLIAFAVVCTTSFATQAQQNSEPHRVGAQLNAGGASYKSSKQDGDGVMSLYLYYNYQFNETWALEIGLNGGTEIDDWNCKELNNKKFICDRNDELLFGIGADELNYNNLVVATKGQFQLTKNSYLYGKIGGQYYDYEIAKNNSKILNQDGLGMFAEGGWQYDWDNGFAFNAGIQYLTMGDLDISSLNVGMSYRF